MGSFSIFHWVIALAWLAAIGFPVSKILRRLGLSPWWTVVAFVPVLNLGGLWMLASTRWDVREANYPPK